jgi:hypothetical protein
MNNEHEQRIKINETIVASDRLARIKNNEHEHEHEQSLTSL